MRQTCAWPECQRHDVLARGLCDRDYRRARRAGILDSFEVTVRTCESCGESFSAGKHGKSFCSDDCRDQGRIARLAQRRADRAATKSDRACAGCGGAIPSSVRAGAQHCSVTCQQASWYAADAARLRAAARVWAKANPDRRNDAEHRRRARQTGAGAGSVDRAELWRSSDGCCALCSLPIDPNLRHPDPLCGSVDHIIPLSKGGAHNQVNVQLTHLRCNLKKGVKTAPTEVVV